MKTFIKIARVVFFPIFWMIDIRRYLMIQNKLFVRKAIFDIFASNMIDNEKPYLAKNFISCSRCLYLEDTSQEIPSIQEVLYNAFHPKNM